MTMHSQDNTPRQDDAAPASSDETMDAFDAALVEIGTEDTGAPADAAAQDGGTGNDFDSAEPNAAPANPDTGKAADNKAPASNPSPAETSHDIWANAPAELREAHERALRDTDLKYRSAASRQAALERKVAELTSRVGQQGGGVNDQAKAEDAAKDGSNGRLAELREDFPDLAPLIDQIETLQQGKDKADQVLSKVEQQETQAFIAAQEGILTETHPDWQEVAVDERFTGWLEEQSTSVREAFQRNFHAVVDGKDAALVIGLFKSDMGIQSSARGAVINQPDPQQQRRERQLKANRDTSRPGGPATTQGFAEEDFDAVVNALADKM
jgi:hypothetical protein